MFRLRSIATYRNEVTFVGHLRRRVPAAFGETPSLGDHRPYCGVPHSWASESGMPTAGRLTPNPNCRNTNELRLCHISSDISLSPANGQPN
jgi:hypothetical protein